jgi:hypothetical protein
MGPHRNAVEKAQHRQRIAALYLAGKTQLEIAHTVAISPATVTRDLKFIQAEWLKSTLRDFDAVKAVEVAKIDQVEAEAWQAWHDSKLESVTTSLRTDGGVDVHLTKKTATVKKVKRTGNVDYLTMVMACIDARCRIFGVYAPAKISIQDADRILDDLIAKEAAEQAGAIALASDLPPGYSVS